MRRNVFSISLKLAFPLSLSTYNNLDAFAQTLQLIFGEPIFIW